MSTKTRNPAPAKLRSVSGRTRTAAPLNPALRGPVLLATRGSDDSEAASIMAQLIAARLGRNLNIVSIVEPALPVGLASEMQVGVLTMDNEALRIRESDINGAFAAKLLPTLEWNAAVRFGHPALDVSSDARAMDATFIVVGASPHRRLRRIVSGQRAAQILHRAASPVLSVAPWLRNLPRHVVAGVDFNQASARAAQAALMIMEKGGQLTLVHVMPTHLALPSEPGNDNVLKSSIEVELQKLSGLLQAQAPDGVSIRSMVLAGDPAAELVNYADKTGADLLAIGTGRSSALRRALVGSVATEVFHASLCSVLASPAPTAADDLMLEMRMTE